MLNTLSVATFEPHVGQQFRMQLAAASHVEVTLVEASPLATDGDARRQRAPFRLIFRGPASQVASQAIYSVEHDSLAPMSIFLVPIRADAAGVYYEAIFT
ncbi:MAG: hypothetical protein ABJF01_03455 [bacterium]